MKQTLSMLVLVALPAFAIRTESGLAEKTKFVPVMHPSFLQDGTDLDYSYLQSNSSDPMELAVSTKTYPCILNVNSAIIDLTFLRAGADNVTGGWALAVDDVNTPTVQFVYAWCQALSETTVVPGLSYERPCAGEVFA